MAVADETAASPSTPSLFGRSSFVLISGTAFAQLLTVLAAPVLTRLFSQAELGYFSVFTALVLVCTPVLSLRLELAIPLPEDDLPASGLLVLGLAFTVISSGLIAVAAWIFQFAFIHTRLLELPRVVVLWLPAGLLMSGIFQILSGWQIRKSSFRDLTISRVLQTTAGLAGTILMGVSGLGAVALVSGLVAGQAIGAAFLARSVRRTVWTFARDLKARYLLLLARSYSGFAVTSTTSGLVNTAGGSIAPLCVAAIYGPAVAGLFALTTRVVLLPMTLVGNALAQVYLSRAPALLRDNPQEVEQLFGRTIRRLLVLGGVPLVLLGVFSPALFGWIFGEGWRESGVYVALLVPLFLAQLCISPLSQTLLIIQKQHLQLAWDVLRLVVVLLAFVVSYRLGLSARGGLLLYSVATAMCYILLLAVSARQLKTVTRVTA